MAFDLVVAAKDLAWMLYLVDVKEKLNTQKAEWVRGQPTYTMMMTVPSSEKLNHILESLTAAVDVGLGQALGQVNDLIDGIDNGDDKRVAAVKRLRAEMEEAAESIRAMQSSHVSVAK